MQAKCLFFQLDFFLSSVLYKIENLERTMRRKSKIMWIAFFVLIFLLSQDYLFVNWQGQTGVFGFPKWIAWFAFVHLIFIAALYWFSKKYWR